MASLPKVLALCGVVVSIFARAPVTAQDTNPRATVERLIEAVRSYKEGSNGSLSASEAANNVKAAKMANSSLAIKEVSRKSLGPQWEKLTDAQRGDFVALVTDLFEKVAYPKSSTFFGDLTIDFKDEKVNGEKAVVRTNVRHPKEGLVAIDYKLERGTGGWVIYDIVLDEVSLATDLRSQIQKVLREESYARLLERMRKKLTEES